MSYRNLISCHVSDVVRAEFIALAKVREGTVASLLRQMIVREIRSVPDDLPQIRKNLFFTVVGIDALMSAHPDPELRTAAIKKWREAAQWLDARNDD